MRYSHLGIQFALSVGLLAAAGFWLDRRWGLIPLFTFLGLFGGFALGLYNLCRELFPTEERPAPDDDAPESGPPEDT